MEDETDERAEIDIDEPDEDAEDLRISKDEASKAEDEFRAADEALSQGRPDPDAAAAALTRGLEHVVEAIEIFPDDQALVERLWAERIYAKQALAAIAEGRIAAAAALVCRLCHPERAKTHAAPLMVMPDEIAPP